MVRAIRTTEIYKCPKHLIIQIKRFQTHYDNNFNSKNSKAIKFDEIIDLESLLVSKELPSEYYKMLSE